MSISREIWRRASPSNKRLFLRARAALPAAIGVSFVALCLTQVPWASALDHMRERSGERAALAPLLADARRENLTFPQVVVAHPAHLNKVVYWDVTVQSSTSSYADGRPSYPVIWTNPERVSRELLWYQTPVLARVQNVYRDVVYLEYLGKP